MAIHQEKIAGLDVICLGDWRSATKLVILLHGFGANFHDLVPLGEFLQRNADTAFLFPNGVTTLPELAPFGGRAWFKLDIEKLNYLAQTANLESIAQAKHPGIEMASESLAKFLETLQAESKKKIILGGFSQGAILSMHTFLTHGSIIDGLLLWSPTVVHSELWQQKFSDGGKTKIPIYISHGRNDQILPFSLSDNLFQMAKNASFPVVFTPFSGGHEIPQKIIEQSAQFLGGI